MLTSDGQTIAMLGVSGYFTSYTYIHTLPGHINDAISHGGEIFTPRGDPMDLYFTNPHETCICVMYHRRPSASRADAFPVSKIESINFEQCLQKITKGQQ
jgi:hypothetical protein